MEDEDDVRALRTALEVDRDCSGVAPYCSGCFVVGHRKMTDSKMSLTQTKVVVAAVVELDDCRDVKGEVEEACDRYLKMRETGDESVKHEEFYCVVEVEGVVAEMTDWEVDYPVVFVERDIAHWNCNYYLYDGDEEVVVEEDDETSNEMMDVGVDKKRMGEVASARDCSQKMAELLQRLLPVALV